MLEVSELSVGYGPVAAVVNASLRVDHGEAVAIIGPNGAGKTSLLMAIAGAVPAQAGKVLLHGETISERPAHEIARHGLSLVPEGRQIFGRLTVEENLRLGLAARRGANRTDDQGRETIGVSEVLRRFRSLERLRNRRADTLSGGEQQQLAIGRALVTQPSVLCLDEPSLGLAPLMVKQVFATIEDLRAEGTTILLVEQVTGTAIAFADRTLLMKDGRLREFQSESALSDQLESAYLGRDRAKDVD